MHCYFPKIRISLRLIFMIMRTLFRKHHAKSDQACSEGDQQLQNPFPLCLGVFCRARLFHLTSEKKKRTKIIWLTFEGDHVLAACFFCIFPDQFFVHASHHINTEKNIQSLLNLPAKPFCNGHHLIFKCSRAKVTKVQSRFVPTKTWFCWDSCIDF